MPYIPSIQRKNLDPLIDELAMKVVAESRQQKNEAAFVGILNYVCTRLALKVIRERFGKMRYWIIAAVSGVFSNIADEFYRRVGVPYEDKQMEKNKDVDLYSLYVH